MKNENDIIVGQPVNDALQEAVLLHQAEQLEKLPVDQQQRYINTNMLITFKNALSKTNNKKEFDQKRMEAFLYALASKANWTMGENQKTRPSDTLSLEHQELLAWMHAVTFNGLSKYIEPFLRNLNIAKHRHPKRAKPGVCCIVSGIIGSFLLIGAAVAGTYGAVLAVINTLKGGGSSPVFAAVIVSFICALILVLPYTGSISLLTNGIQAIKARKHFKDPVHYNAALTNYNLGRFFSKHHGINKSNSVLGSIQSNAFHA